MVCLEQGGWTAAEDHPHFSRDWEWQKQGRWNPNTNVRRAVSDYPVETNSSNVLMWNAVGGSTNVYGAYQPIFKIIPRTLIYARAGKKLSLHGGGVAVKS